MAKEMTVDEAVRIIQETYEFGNEFDLSIKLWTIDDFGGWEKAYQKYFDDDAMFDEIYNY